jgi:hypothetical protein
MADLSALSFAEHARNIAASPELESALEVIVDLALSSTGSDFASVTLVHADGAVETVAASDPVVESADALQYTLHEGPCLTAAENNGVYVIADTSADERWPQWGPGVAALGLRSVLSIHLFTDGQALGALNLYAKDLRTFSRDDVDVARIVAAHASVALARFRIEHNLWSAVDARHLIGQAQGILMERYSITSEKAFAVLRRYSQNHNRKLHDIAATLVSTGELPDRPADLAAAQNWQSPAPTQSETGASDGAALDAASGGAASGGVTSGGAAPDGGGSNGAAPDSAIPNGGGSNGAAPDSGIPNGSASRNAPATAEAGE